MSNLPSATSSSSFAHDSQILESLGNFTDLEVFSRQPAVTKQLSSSNNDSKFSNTSNKESSLTSNSYGGEGRGEDGGNGDVEEKNGGKDEVDVAARDYIGSDRSEVTSNKHQTSSLLPNGGLKRGQKGGVLGGDEEGTGNKGGVRRDKMRESALFAEFERVCLRHLENNN